MFSKQDEIKERLQVTVTPCRVAEHSTGTMSQTSVKTIRY